MTTFVFFCTCRLVCSDRLNHVYHNYFWTCLVVKTGYLVLQKKRAYMWLSISGTGICLIAKVYKPNVPYGTYRCLYHTSKYELLHVFVSNWHIWAPTGVCIKLAHMSFYRCVYQTGTYELLQVFVSNWHIWSPTGVCIKLAHMISYRCLYQTGTHEVLHVFVSNWHTWADTGVCIKLAHMSSYRCLYQTGTYVLLQCLYQTGTYELLQVFVSN